MNGKLYARIESKLRRQAKVVGLQVVKSRRTIDAGMFYVRDPFNNTIVAGYDQGAEFDLYDLATEEWAKVTPGEMRILSKEAGVA